MLNLFSGGALENLSIFALGIMPYVSSSIILQLMGMVYKPIDELRKEVHGIGGKANCFVAPNFAIGAVLMMEASKLIAPHMPEVEITDTCPECGAAMKLREKRWGGGGYFLGCSKYPKCKGTREVSPELMEQVQS